MPDLAADLTQTYAPRLAEFVSDERFGPWTCKLYGLADPAKGVREELLEVTRELAGRSLPEDGYGASISAVASAAWSDATDEFGAATGSLLLRTRSRGVR